MILIISQKGLEESTNDVIDWISYKKGEFIRLNGEDVLENCHISIDNNIIDIKEPLKNYDNANILWFRRWWYTPSLYKFDESDITNRDLNKIKVRERIALTESFFSVLDDKNWLDHSLFGAKRMPCKIAQLIAARRSGLRVPDTIITNSKNELESFLNKHVEIITKALSDVGYLSYKGKMYVGYTAPLSKKDLKILPDKFQPTLFQKNIKKQAEIRVFYFFEKIYAMAIFSGNDKKTETDFRKYNWDKPNRNVPFNLPEEVSERIISLMKDIDLNHGSLDLILTHDNDFVFLEINPHGQFGMVSYPCNYNIEEEIASYLIDNDHK
jgi:ATP-GRASP peptide maturase of grasp-with-spasm system